MTMKTFVHYLYHHTTIHKYIITHKQNLNVSMETNMNSTIKTMYVQIML